MLIDPTVEAKAVPISMRAGQTLQVVGVLESDVIAIEAPNGAGGWKSFTIVTVVQSLTATNEEFHARGNTLVRVNKPTTTNAVGIALR